MWDSERVPDRMAVRLTSDGEMLLLRPWPPVACVATAAATGLSPMIQSRMSSASTPTVVARPAGRYVAAVPLRAPQGPAQALMPSGYSLGLWDLQHFMVLLRPDPARTQTPTQEQESSLVFDFQPRDPEDALAAFSVLSRSKIPGVVRRRTLQRIPDRRSWFVDLSDGDAAAAAEKFSEQWPTDLVVGNHDCRDYTNGLVEVLTGQKRVLDSLRSAGRQ